MLLLDERQSARPRAEGAREFLGQLDGSAGRQLLDKFLADRCADRRNALAEHYCLCGQIVARQLYGSLPGAARRLVDLEDVEQTSLQQIHRVIERYDPSRGVPMSAYLMVRLPHAVIDEFRAAGVVVRKDRVDPEACRTLWLDDDQFAFKRNSLEARTPAPDRQMELREFRKSVLRSVPREYRLLVAFRCFRGLQIWQVARRMGLSCAEAQHLWHNARVWIARGLRMTMGDFELPDLPPIADLEANRCEEIIRRQKQRSNNHRGFTYCAAKISSNTDESLVPTELRRQKEFRRWFVLNIPWMYRRFAAYHHLRGLDLNCTAARLAIAPDKVRILDRSSRVVISRALERYRGSQQLAVAA